MCSTSNYYHQHEQHSKVSDKHSTHVSSKHGPLHNLISALAGLHDYTAPATVLLVSIVSLCLSFVASLLDITLGLPSLILSIPLRIGQSISSLVIRFVYIVV